MTRQALSWTLLERLAAVHGEELYLLDLEAVRRNYLEWEAALRTEYAESTIAYSYKTNYTPAICRLVHQLGGHAEVVSTLELDLTEQLGVPGSRVIFNGPYKRAADIERAVRSGALIFLDGIHEVRLVETALRTHEPACLRLGLRCHVELPGSGSSRFGFDPAGPDFAEAVDRLVRLPGCGAINLHAHYLAAWRRPEDFAAIARQLLAACARLPAHRRPEVIDVGGGFYSRMPPELAAQFGGHTAQPCEYASAIGAVMRTAFPSPPRPQLVIEPGMALVADAMSLAARVIATKNLAGRRIALVASSRYSLQPTFSRRQLPAIVYRSPAHRASDALSTPHDVVGYTCLEDDCLLRNFPEPLAPGDWVVFDHVGAYTNVLRPPFIAPCPAILTIDDAGRPEIVKRADRTNDVFASYVNEPAVSRLEPSPA